MPDELEDGGIDGGNGVGIDAGGDSGFTTHVAEMSEETKAGDIGAGASESDRGEGCSGGVESCHFLGGFGGEGFRGETFLDRGGNDPGANGFGEEKVISGLCSGIGNDVVRIDETGDRESVKRFGILHGVSTGEGAARFGDFVGSAFKDLIDGVEREEIGGHGDDVHRGDGLATHGIDVGEGIRGCDLSEEIGVVDDGSEEIEGLDKCQVRRNSVNGGVIGAGRSDEEIGILNVGNATQDLREFGLAELGGSSSAGGHFRQAFDVFATHMRGG